MRTLSASSRMSRLLLFLLAVAVSGMAVLAQDRSGLYLLVPLAFVAGALVVVLWRRNDVTPGQVLVVALLARLLLAWLPPSLSDDAFRYVWDGRVQVEGINPYQYVPSDTALAAWHEEPVYKALNSKAYYTVYPPVSQAVFAFGGLFYRVGWKASYYVIKIIFLLFEVAALLLLARLVAARWLLLYALAPLVLLETAGQAHTEAAMLFFLVLTVFFARNGMGSWAAAALTLAGWVKLYPLVLLPVLWRRYRWQAVWPAVVVSVVVAAPYAAPYVVPHVRSSLDLYAHLFEFNAGLYYGIKKLFLWGTGADWSKQIGPALRVLFLAGLPVLYVLDARRQWSLPRVMLIGLGFFLVMATTVHPWYLLSLLILAALLERPAWHWHWLALCSIGTYLLYVEGPYWPFVIAGWGGWLALATVQHVPSGLQAIQRFRAWRKLGFIRRYLPRLMRPLDVLDLGAGEGYVGRTVQHRLNARVTLADVIGMNRTRLPHLLYDGRHLPFSDAAFDVVILYFVLHHTEMPDVVLREALRVARLRVVIVESVYEGKWDHKLLTVLDRWANRMRSGGRMTTQEEHLHFRTCEAWRAMIGRLRGEVLAERHRGRWLHKQALFVVAPHAGEA
jgi:alpha-1,6-mannosyltransferase